jgi:DNA-binding response OmpR family regulator
MKTDLSKGSVEILVVEDSPTQAEQLKYLLEQQGYHLSAARTGREALAYIGQHAPRLVISDVVMPEMDGYELCRQIKHDEKLRDIPVILLTSLNDPVDVVRGLECGADSFIFKPYDEQYLLARIAYILANRHLRESESTRMGVDIVFAGRRFFITSDRLQILNLLLSTYEAAVQRSRALATTRDELRHLNENLEAKVKERTAALQMEVSERRRAEEQVRHLNAELEQRVHESRQQRA